MSLLAQVQALTERTYRQATGVNFEHFLIGYRRFRRLSQRATADELSDAARVFFRVENDLLYLALYFDHALIRVLERNDPRAGLSERNISAFMIFIEEINHAVHGALKFLDGETDLQQESFIRNLEIQARVDIYLLLKYFLACFNPSKQLEKMDRLWLRHHVFETADYSYQSRILRERYMEANMLGERFCRFLEGLPVPERQSELSRFREMDYPQKKRYVRLLPN